MNTVFRDKSIRVYVPPDLGPLIRGGAQPASAVKAAGLEAADIEAMWAGVEAIYRTGLHPSIGLCVRRRGHVVIDRTIGWARGHGPGDSGPAVLCTPDTPFCIFSASKAVTAMVIHMLDDRGLVHIDDRVADYIPEFAANGKQWVTLRHVLCHRAGIPNIGDETNIELLYDWDGIVARLCDATPTSRGGRRLAYHAITGGFILGEVVRRVTGRDIRTFLQYELLDPLGFQGMNYGIAPERNDEVVTNYFTGPPLRFPFSLVARRALGVGIAEAVEVTNHAAWKQAIVPSGNIYATANELSRFYQLLLNEGELDGTRIFDSRTIRRATNETAHLELDLSLGLPIRYGVGLQLGSRFLSVFGPGTPRAYGHLGFINIYGWADPERDIAVALMTSGKPLVAEHLWPLFALLRTINARCSRR